MHNNKERFLPRKFCFFSLFTIVFSRMVTDESWKHVFIVDENLPGISIFDLPYDHVRALRRTLVAAFPTLFTNSSANIHHFVAFNPSLVLLNGRLVSFFRFSDSQSCFNEDYDDRRRSVIGMTILSDGRFVTSFLEFPYADLYSHFGMRRDCPYQGAEDPRVLQDGSFVYILTSVFIGQECNIHPLVAVYRLVGSLRACKSFTASCIRFDRWVVLQFHRRAMVEKNWIPVRLSGGELIVLYKMCPHPVFLGCSMHSGLCVVRQVLILSRPCTYISSTPFVEIPWQSERRLLTVVHEKRAFGGSFQYASKAIVWDVHKDSRTVVLSESPLMYISRPQLDEKRKGFVEYSTGLVYLQKQKQVWLSYGVGDCYARFAAINLSQLVNLTRKVRMGIYSAWDTRDRRKFAKIISLTTRKPKHDYSSSDGTA